MLLCEWHFSCLVLQPRWMFPDPKEMFSYEEKKTLLEARYPGVPMLYASTESNVCNDPFSPYNSTSGNVLIFII